MAPKGRHSTDIHVVKRDSEVTMPFDAATFGVTSPSNAAITRSRRKSATDIVVKDHVSKVRLPAAPQSARKPSRRPSGQQFPQPPQPLRQRMAAASGVVNSVTPSMAGISSPQSTSATTTNNVAPSNADISSSMNDDVLQVVEEEEDIYSVAPKVSRDDDDDSNIDCGPDLIVQNDNSSSKRDISMLMDDDTTGNNSVVVQPTAPMMIATTLSTAVDNRNSDGIVNNSTTLVIAALTIEQIHAKMLQLYRMPKSCGINGSSTTNWNELIFHRPCVSARIFACFLLWIDQSAMEGTLMSNLDIQLIQPLLLAMVHVEAISLESDASSTDDDTKVTAAKKRKATPSKIKDEKQRKVHFLSLDGSSIRPPIDRDLQSGVRQQQSIEAMTHAKKVIVELTSDAVSSLQVLQTYLKTVQSPVSEGANIIQLCASSISNEHPLKLVWKTINVILNDLIILQERLTSDLQQPLQLEVRLAEHIGQAIRYQLRVLFNPAPPRLCSLDAKYEIRSLTYSQVHQLMTMTKRAPIGLAVDDGFLSALISRALCRLHVYFDLEYLLPGSEDAFDSVIPSDFCTSEPSRRQISKRIRSTGSTDAFTENDRDLVVADIQQAASFLAATYAARFMYDVFTTPGVEEEVRRMGGWSSVERYASTSKEYKLYESCSSDAHLVPLCNYTALLKRLQTLCEFMEPKTQSCIDALEMVAKNYYIPDPMSPTKQPRKLHHYIHDIVNTYTDMIMEVNAFPQVLQSPPEYDVV